MGPGQSGPEAKMESPAPFPQQQWLKRNLREQPGEKAFAFLSRSFVEAQRSAEIDFKVFADRTKSLKEMVASPPSLEDWDQRIKIPLNGKEVTAGELLRKLQDSGKRALESSKKPMPLPHLEDWEKIKIPLQGGKDVTAGDLVKQLQDSGRRAFEGPSWNNKNPLGFDDFDVVKSLQERLPPALTELQKRFPEGLSSLPKTPVSPGKEFPLSFFPEFKDVPAPWSQDASKKRERREDSRPAGSKGAGGGIVAGAWGKETVLLRPFDGREFTSFAEWNKAVKEHKWRLQLPPAAEATLEPIKKSITEGLRELQEQTVAAAASVSSPKEATVAPLAVPEVLEALARTSEEVLVTLGVKPDVTAKVSSALRKCKDASQRLAGPRAEEGSARAESDSFEQRMAEIMESTGYQHKNDGLNNFGEHLHRSLGQALLPGRRMDAGVSADGQGAEKSIMKKRRNVAIVTTASLPWMTGTAVNPLLRAAYLARLGEQDVTLVIPWLSKEDQVDVYPQDITFDTPAEQEAYVRSWLEQRVGFSPKFKISFYPGKFSREKRSIFPAGDISQFVPDEEADIAVLEEPEHLAWYYHGQRWTDKFRHVVGIIHTNYLEYVKREKNGRIQAALLEHVNNWMVRCYCHKVVRLSGATQDFPRSTVCNVHGVGVKFLDIGDSMAKEMEAGKMPFTKGAYYLGKMVWSKGYRELVDLLALNYNQLGSKLRVDVFGSGEDADAVRSEAEARGLKLEFHKGRDHADSSLHQFKVFINPSVSDVVCTTTAEALAMGKIVVCADHPSNDFFRSFPNCLIYRTPDEFVEKVQEALAAQPEPLTAEQRHQLTWEAATQRFLQSADLETLMQPASAAATPPLSSEAWGQGLTPIASEGDLQKSLSADGRTDAPAMRRTKSWDDLDGLPVPEMAGPGRTRAASTAAASGLMSGAPASLTMALPAPDVNDLLDRFLSFSHFMASGVEFYRDLAGAAPDSMHVPEDLSKELGLPPPWVQRPTYGW